MLDDSAQAMDGVKDHRRPKSRNAKEQEELEGETDREGLGQERNRSSDADPYNRIVS